MPADIPTPSVGQDARISAARNRAALIEADGRLAADAATYCAIPRDFSALGCPEAK